MYRTRWNATVNEANPVRGRLNRSWMCRCSHAQEPGRHHAQHRHALFQRLARPLGEPLFLTVPAMGERYYSFA